MWTLWRNRYCSPFRLNVGCFRFFLLTYEILCVYTSVYHIYTYISQEDEWNNSWEVYCSWLLMTWIKSQSQSWQQKQCSVRDSVQCLPVTPWWRRYWWQWYVWTMFTHVLGCTESRCWKSCLQCLEHLPRMLKEDFQSFFKNSSVIYPSPSSSQFRVPKPLAPFPHRHNAFLGEMFLNSCTFSAPFSFLIYFNISKCSSSSLSLFIGISCFTQSPFSSSCYHLLWVLSWIFYIIRYQGEASNQLSDAVKNTWGNSLTMRKVLFWSTVWRSQCRVV